MSDLKVGEEATVNGQELLMCITDRTMVYVLH